MLRQGRILAAAGLVAVSTLGAGAALAADTYALDTGHTEIRFLYNHVGLSTQAGEFRDFEGTVLFDKENIGNSKVEVTIQAASLDSGVAKLDDHMRGADMFDVETHPEITFKSTKVVQTGVDRGQAEGELTMKGKTIPIVLDIELNFDGPHPLAPFIEAYAGANYTGFSARGRVLRSAFDLGYGTPLVSDEIDIVIEAELRQQL